MRSRPGRALAIGVGVAAVYMVVAWWAGRTGPLGRRPLLDGFGQAPPPYNWVSPPPALASQNKKPAAGSFDVPLNPQAGSEATVLSTDDGQASLALNDGSVPPRKAQDSVKVTITPLAPTGLGAPPSGQAIAGNVYRIVADYQPSGDPISSLEKPAQVVLAYPSEAGGSIGKHQLLVSTDGRTWTAVDAIDSHAQLLIQTTVSTVGYFAVGKVAGTTGGGGGIGSVLIYGVVGLSLLVVAFFILRTERRIRRERREIVYGKEGKGRSSAGRKGRPRRDRSRRDPFQE